MYIMYVIKTISRGEEMELVSFTVGEKFPLFQNSLKEMKYQDGAVFESMEEGQGFLLSVCFNQPSPKEIEILRKEKIHVRLIEEEGFVLPLIRFGEHAVIFELSLDPTLYEDARAMQLTEKNNTMVLAVIDTSNEKIMGIRHSNLPLKMIQTCADSWARAYLDADYSQKYSKWFQKLQNISLEALWSYGVPAGELGETYDLNEIQFSRDSQFYKK